jgi:hypothetical protein
MTVATVLPRGIDPERITALSQTVSDYIEKHNVSAIVKVHSAETPLIGACELANAYGFGPLSPNTILLGVTEKTENYDQFSNLIKQVHIHKQNLVVVHEDNEEHYIHEERSRIDVWWYGTQQNLGFMLTLAHLLTRGSVWKHADFSIKSIVKNEEDLTKTRERIEEFIAKARVEARAEVFIQKDPNVFDNIKEYSKGADLVLLGLRAPGEDESTEEYTKYYHQLLGNIQDMPPTALVLASESIDFFGIFQQA